MNLKQSSVSAHLSDDALDDMLLDAGSASDAQHLASCEQCAERLVAFRSSLAWFNQASSGWAQARSNGISRELVSRQSRFAILPAWSVAAAFFFAVALSFLVGIHRGLTPNATVLNEAQWETSTTIDRQQEIASDNEMLHAIDTAISQPVASPVEVSGIDRTAVRPRSRSREVRD